MSARKNSPASATEPADDDRTGAVSAKPSAGTSGQWLDGRVPIGAALRRVLQKGYGPADLRADLLAGITVGIVALPLSMALAIAVGVPPQHGLYTTLVAGAVVALLGGCKFQVTGPTAAFVVVLAPIVSRHGLSGLLTAGFLAGVFLVVFGLAHFGSLIRFIPYPVTTGFTTGIAVVIATLQVKDLFGLEVAAMPEHYLEKLGVLWRARDGVRLSEFVVAAITFALLLMLPRVIRRVPAPLLAIGLVSVGVVVTAKLNPEFAVATIGSRFSSTSSGAVVIGIPSHLPSFDWPWGEHLPSFATVRELLPSAFAIALLGAIESLLSAVIADGLTGTQHEPNSELLGLGIGNLLAPLFGGIAATGALARTATNIRSGARSPFAAVTHSVVVLLCIVLLARLVAYVPMASLSALLLLVAWNMSELRNFIGVIRIAPRGDVVVLLTCFGLTVFFDMVVAVSIGVILACLIFMRRTASLTESRLFLDSAEEVGHPALPKGVALYEINGPLFFGAAQHAVEALASIRERNLRVFVLSLARVPAIDATGFAALENAIAGLVRRGHRVVISGPLPRPREIFDKADLSARHRNVQFEPDLAAALRAAEAQAGHASETVPASR